MDFKYELKSRITYIDEQMDKVLPKQEEYPSVLFEAMRYSIFAGGKRLRPIFLLEACKAFGGDYIEAVPFACSIEMIHTYSLIHDDLPAMDNDDYRRGRLTSHKVFGENMAILAGDALLHQAFETMANATVNSKKTECAKALLTIAEASGSHGMVAGQVVDVISEGKEIDEATLGFIHTNKTAAMIQGALKAGAILGGATDDDIENIFKAGEKIGIAFQIQDDILDIISTMEVLGKPIDSDRKNHKITYATLYGVDGAKKLVEKMSDEAVEILKGLKGDMGFIIALTEYLIKREY